MDTKASNRGLLIQAIQQLGTRLAGFEKTLEMWGDHISHLQLAAMDTERLSDEMLQVRKHIEMLEKRLTALEAYVEIMK